MGFSHRIFGLAVGTAVTTVYAQGSATCSSSQISTTESVVADYVDALNGNCDVNPCSDSCVATMAALANGLPDCVYTDKINYYETMQVALSGCDAISGATTPTDGTTSGTSTASTDSSTCSISESADTASYLAEYSDALSSNCDSEACSTDCVTTMSELAVYLPNCVYTDGTNYYESLEDAIATCASIPMAPETTSGSTPSTSETASDSTPATPETTSGSTTTTTSGSTPSTTSATTSPSTTDEATATTTNECSSAEVSDTASYVSAVNTELESSCSDDMCSSACLAILKILSTQLPDCIDTDGVNYYESVIGTITTCSSTSSGSTSSTTSSSTSDSESSENPLYPMLKKSGSASSKRKNGADRARIASLSMLAITTTLALALLVA